MVQFKRDLVWSSTGFFHYHLTLLYSIVFKRIVLEFMRSFINSYLFRPAGISLSESNKKRAES